MSFHTGLQRGDQCVEITTISSPLSKNKLFEVLLLSFPRTKCQFSVKFEAKFKNKLVNETNL